MTTNAQHPNTQAVHRNRQPLQAFRRIAQQSRVNLSNFINPHANVIYKLTCAPCATCQEDHQQVFLTCTGHKQILDSYRETKAIRAVEKKIVFSCRVKGSLS